jgi:hypothetical protein
VTKGMHSVEVSITVFLVPKERLYTFLPENHHVVHGADVSKSNRLEGIQKFRDDKSPFLNHNTQTSYS